MKYLLFILALITSSTYIQTAEAAGPCKTIVESCIGAGVIPANASRQTMLDKCVKPILSGKNVAGVQVNPAIVTACGAKIQAR